MKLMLLLATLMLSTSLLAKVCDLSANNQAVDEINARFDEGRMRGEDHAVALKELYELRLASIENCAQNDRFGGITQQELIDTLDEMNYKLGLYIKEMNKAIEQNIQNDRPAMAAQLTLERDQEVAVRKLLMEKIKKQIK